MNRARTWYRELPLFGAAALVALASAYCFQWEPYSAFGPNEATLPQRAPLSETSEAASPSPPAGILGAPCPDPSRSPSNTRNLEVPPSANAISLAWPSCKGISDWELEADQRNILVLKHPVNGWRSEFFPRDTKTLKIRFRAKPKGPYLTQNLSFIEPVKTREKDKL